MRIETISIKTATIAIFSMIAVVAIVLSLLAGAYFRQSALDAQVNSLSRVLEVATREMQQRMRERSFELGMKLAHSRYLVQAFNQALRSGNTTGLVEQLDDPIITGFVGFSEINLVKLRAYTDEFALVGESSAGRAGLEPAMPALMEAQLRKRPREDRLKGLDIFWQSGSGPLHSFVIPLGGLRPVGYLEVVVDPLFNFEGISDITQTPVSIYSSTGELVNTVNQDSQGEFLPVEYVLHSSDGQPAYRIVGLEDVEALSAEMARIRTVTVGGFLLLSLATLLLALWLFTRFMLSPVEGMVRNMRAMVQGRLTPVPGRRALREFHELTDAFNAMARQVRMRTNDLERLLDLDDSAILCFDRDREVVYFNRSATVLFGYTDDEISDLDLPDLFADDVPALMESLVADGGRRQDDKLHVVLGCRHKQGDAFRCDAVINIVDIMGQRGHAIVLNAVAGDEHAPAQQGEQRLDAVEKSMTSLLALVRNNPSLLDGLGESLAAGSAAATDKATIREQAVGVMSLSLACWEHELGKSKLDLAEESGIWPVYIDKSTPTTRTLDKYLSLDNCPKNPRSKRVIDTAEFVLRRLPDDSSDACTRLRAALDAFRQLLSGL